GETGAGKSIVVDSLGLLAGGRASNELIRTGAEQLTVTGIFEPDGSAWRRVLEEAGLEGEGNEIIVRREVSRSGRNRVFVNDQPTTLRLLSELAPFLLRIHGQREELDLLSADLQRSWLDRSGGAEGAPLLERCAQAHAQYRRLADRLEDVTGNERLRFERIDLLRFQIGEINAAKLSAGEDEDLHRERDQLRNAEAIEAALGGAASHLFDDEGAATERLAKSLHLLRGIAAWQPEVEAWCTELDELRIRTEEVAASLRGHLDGQEPNPGRLDAVEGRLAAIERLCRKYAPSVAEILEHESRMKEELSTLEADSQSVGELRQETEQALAAYRKAAAALSQARGRWGKALAARMASELADLGLDKARLEVELSPRPESGSALQVGGKAVEFGPKGYDQVSFLFSPNPGEAAQPLARVASGGELSRVSLALQLAAGGEGARSRPTLVFDEVDTGVGGAVAAALGRKLQRLASGGQILAVTHLPQVASFGDRQFLVSKEVRKGRTYAEVEPLDREAREEEIARMLAGEEIT
ncbi:MAG: DNA repair protein RecN, partial [Acidobacteria bacterium]|nr:DNA repair protein RecN [Acidobacteriota bacterium]